MKSMKMRGLLIGIVSMLVMAVPMAGLAAEEVTIVGEVNDTYQIVGDDGEIYDVAETDMGNELVENHISEKVKVTGTVEQQGDIKIITVSGYQVVTE